MYVGQREQCTENNCPMAKTLTYKLKFTWTIEHFSKLNARKHYSKIFSVEGHKWRVLIYPRGNDVDHLSIYLDVADSARLPSGWSRYASFTLAVVSQIRPKLTVKHETQHTFNAQDSDCGFTSFMPLLYVHDPAKGYLVNDTLIVEAEINARRVVDYGVYDSRKQTGFNGLKNLGATGQSEAASSSQSSVIVGSRVGQREISIIHNQEINVEDAPKRLEQDRRLRLGVQEIHVEDPPKRPGQDTGLEGEGETQNVQHKGVLEAPIGMPCKSMTEEQISTVLRDITRGLVPVVGLEDPKWPSSAGEMAHTFAPVVRLVDDFRAMKEEVERLRIRAMTLHEAMNLSGREGGAKPETHREYGKEV